MGKLGIERGAPGRPGLLPFGPGESIPDVSAFSVGQMNHGVGYCAPLWIGNPALNLFLLCVNSAGQNAKTSNNKEQPSGDTGADSRAYALLRVERIALQTGHPIKSIESVPCRQRLVVHWPILRRGLCCACTHVRAEASKVPASFGSYSRALSLK